MSGVCGALRCGTTYLYFCVKGMCTKNLGILRVNYSDQRLELTFEGPAGTYGTYWVRREFPQIENVDLRVNVEQKLTLWVPLHHKILKFKWIVFFTSCVCFPFVFTFSFNCVCKLVQKFLWYQI